MNGKIRTSRKAFKTGAVEWLSFKVGVSQYVLYSTCERARVYTNVNRCTYSAVVDTKTIGKKFHTEMAACKAASRALGMAGLLGDMS